MTVVTILSVASIAISTVSVAIATRAKRDFEKMKRDALFEKMVENCNVTIPESISAAIAENVNKEILEGAPWARSAF